MEKFNFVPANGFRDTASFPNPVNANDTRNQFMIPLDQLKDYINNALPTYNGEPVKLIVDASTKKIRFSANGTTFNDAVAGVEWESRSV